MKKHFAIGTVSRSTVSASISARHDTSELAQQAASEEPRLIRLSPQKETELVSDTRLLVVAICILNHWTFDDFVAAYRISATECLQRLWRLDKVRLIELFPGNRIRLGVARDFDWLP